MKRIILLACMLLPLLVSAQKKQGQPLLDSLLHVLPSLGNDTNKVRVLYDISHNYHSVNAVEGIKYGEQALLLSNKLDWRKGVAMAYGVLGTNYTYLCDYPRALDYLFKALAINEQIKNVRGQAVNDINIGVVYMKEGDGQEALSYYYKSKALFERLHENGGVALNLSNISIIYQQQQNYPKALECYFIALGIATEMEDRAEEATIMCNIGVVYTSLKEHANSLAYHFRALKLSEELGNKLLSIDNIGNIGVCYRNIATEPALYAKGDSLIPVGKQANLQKSVQYFTRAIAMGKEIGYLDAVQNFYDGLSETYVLLGEKDKALDAYKQHVTIQDYVVSAADKVNITNLETRREVEVKNKELEIEKLKVVNRRNERILYLVGIALLVVIIIVGARKVFTQKRSNDKLSGEKRKYLQHIKVQEDVLQHITHVQSHDLRGPVATILGLARLYDQDNPADPDNKEIVNDIIGVSVKLDKLITSLIKRENKLSASMKDTDKPIT